MSISLEALKKAIKIKEQIASLEAELQQILSGAEAPKAKRGRKKVSAEPVIAEETIQPAKRGRKPKKAKRQMSEEGRKRISEAAKARWAAKRKA